jgi:peptidoglycan/xylan/chitin deacetylase (PgdA/CDA1 family)
MSLRSFVLSTISILLIGFFVSSAIYLNIRKVSVLYFNKNFSQDIVKKGSVFKAQIIKDIKLELAPIIINNFNDPYEVPPIGQVNGTVRIPVALWHHIGPLPGLKGERILNVTEEVFRQEMQHLKNNEYKTLSIDEFIAQIKAGENPKQKSILLTFDDGYLDNYTTVFPILKEFGFKATFFIPLKKSEISNTQLKEMSDAGMDIESHTMTHKVMRNVNNESTCIYEIINSKSILEEITGKPVKALAYPQCVFNNETVKYIQENSCYELTFQCGNTKGTSIDMSWNNRFILHRSWAFNDLGNFKRRISGYENKPDDPLPDSQEGFHFKVI